MAKIKPSKKRAREWQLYVQSLQELKLQWAIGPLSGHRGCCRVASAVAGERLDAHKSAREAAERRGGGDGPAKLNLSVYTTPATDEHQVRCWSVSCRPGDPYGCSMIRARYRADQTAYIVDGWLKAGNRAYLALLEVIGRPGESLKSVMAAGQTAITRAFGGSAWVRSADEIGLAGQIRSLTVAMSDSGAWIFRRWVILSVRTGAREADLDRAANGLAQRWDRSLQNSWLGGARWRVQALQEIDRSGARAVAQLITGAISSLDPRDALHADSLDITFGVPADGERGPATLADAYRKHAKPIANVLKDYAGDDYRGHRVSLDLREPAKSKKRVGILIRERAIDEARWSGRTRVKRDGKFRRISVPAACVPFIEYAVALEGVPVWFARKLRVSGDPVWNGLIDDVAHPKTFPIRYMEKPEVRGTGGGRNAGGKV